MFQIFSMGRRLASRFRARGAAGGCARACQAADLLAHPAIAAMTERQLADLPFPRDPGDVRPPRADRLPRGALSGPDVVFPPLPAVRF